MATKQSITIKSLIEDSPWNIADRLGIDYGGDMSPIPHGGYFYSIMEWTDNGYAECVEFITVENVVIVSIGTIHRDDAEEMSSALRCCGYRYADPAIDELPIAIYSESGELVASDADTITRVEIECAKAYAGCEQDYGQSFPFADDYSQIEWAAFKYAIGHIRALTA